MTKFTKISLKILLSAILNIALINAYGFIIGGYVGWLFYVLFTIINLPLLLFVVGKDFLKEKLIASVVIAIIISFVCGLCYIWENNVFDNQVNNTYESYVMDLQEGRTLFLDRGCYFNNPNGEECFYNYYFDDNYNDGDKIEVKEYNGIFGMKHYRLTVLERNNE